RRQGCRRPHSGPWRRARPHRRPALQRARALLLRQAGDRRMKRITVLGATGSIGLRTLEIVSSFPEEFSVAAVAARGPTADRPVDIPRQYAPQAIAPLEPPAG